MKLRTAAIVVAFVVVLAGCGSDAKNAASSSGDVTKFCDAMTKLRSGLSSSSPELQKVYDDAQANAPAELRADITEFLANARAVSAAFASAGAESQSVDVQSLISSLTPAQKEFVQELAAAASGGASLTGSSGRVFQYVLDHCLTGPAESSTFSTVGSPVN